MNPSRADEPIATIEVLDTSAATPAWVAGSSLTTARLGLGLAALALEFGDVGTGHKGLAAGAG